MTIVAFEGMDASGKGTPFARGMQKKSPLGGSGGAGNQTFPVASSWFLVGQGFVQHLFKQRTSFKVGLSTGRHVDDFSGSRVSCGRFGFGVRRR